MKSSKPFSFVLWVSDDALVKYLAEYLKLQKDFDYFHFIRHKAEKERANVITRATKSKPKPHWHCVCHFRKAIDYDTIIRFRVMLWASEHPKYGECPYTFSRTHEGKVNNICTWLAYVVHDEAYMAYLEKKCDKPECHKASYKWNDIRSTNYDLLNDQVVNALSFIAQLDTAERNLQEAKELGIESESLTSALWHCRTYNQMLVASQLFKARQFESAMEMGQR